MIDINNLPEYVALKSGCDINNGIKGGRPYKVESLIDGDIVLSDESTNATYTVQQSQFKEKFIKYVKH